uniref:Large ribosomal subunit protein bL25 n=1 Tax=Magnetococcus massalia (strain MO-1) TaxID=451514 RepID=A0A1S7LJY6_MAGMO|nr:50S ribosomal protein L25 [Candidatus Magnetococcus massalia]
MATFAAEKRDGAGKGVARKLRAAGRFPAVVYGAGSENDNLTLDSNDFALSIAGQGARLFISTHNLQIDGKEEQVLIRSIQRHPVTSFVEHVDFLRFDPEKLIMVKIPVNITGEEEAPGLKRGGVLQIVRHELEVQCKAGNIPQQIDVSIAELDIGSSFHIDDVVLPEGAKVFTDVNFTIAVVVGVKSEEVGAEEGEADEAAAETEE